MKSFIGCFLLTVILLIFAFQRKKNKSKKFAPKEKCFKDLKMIVKDFRQIISDLTENHIEKFGKYCSIGLICDPFCAVIKI